MVATLSRSKAADLEKRINTTPPQAGSSSGNNPPANRPTYHGPSDDDQLRYTVPLVLGVHSQAPSLHRDYSSQGKDSRPYDRRNRQH